MFLNLFFIDKQIIKIIKKVELIFIIPIRKSKILIEKIIEKN